jgi:nicotinate-nucleotide adenylyltransferase
VKRFGLFGGSFDPVHDAHLALARIALQHLQLDRLYWLPAGSAWQKARALSPAEDRAAMVRLALEGEPRFLLDTLEIDRAGPSYTFDTVCELQGREPKADWFLIIGQDQYANLPSWHRWQELLLLVTLAVAGRAGEEPLASAALAALPHRVERLPLPPLKISSTAIRAALAAGQDVAAMVPAAVARYIGEHHLYTRTH